MVPYICVPHWQLEGHCCCGHCPAQARPAPHLDGGASRVESAAAVSSNPPASVAEPSSALSSPRLCWRSSRCCCRKSPSPWGARPRPPPPRLVQPPPPAGPLGVLAPRAASLRAPPCEPATRGSPVWPSSAAPCPGPLVTPQPPAPCPWRGGSELPLWQIARVPSRLALRLHAAAADARKTASPPAGCWHASAGPWQHQPALPAAKLAGKAPRECHAERRPARPLLLPAGSAVARSPRGLHPARRPGLRPARRARRRPKGSPQRRFGP
mmetsp:Transcript_130557/g.309738  ORF Transcript_130557/g.309738 Transcript_130557/m.309738 type:complete len:268 (+) Transcript_130557:667-1470(+)